MAREERALKIFLYQRMYRSGPVKAVADEAERVLSRLFDAYSADICLLPPQWQPGAPEPVPTLRALGDFIAGLTDRSALRHYRELLGHLGLAEGFQRPLPSTLPPIIPFPSTAEPLNTTARFPRPLSP